MSDKTIQSTHFPTSDRIKSNQAELTRKVSMKTIERMICGHQNELDGKRVMQGSATMMQEVKLLFSFHALYMREVFSITALLDCRATDSFIDKGMIDHLKLEVKALDQPIPIYNADGGHNKLGDITGYVDLEMTIANTKKLCDCMQPYEGRKGFLLGMIGYENITLKLTGRLGRLLCLDA